MILLIFFAFFAGIATVLSPCVLPVLPAILSAGVGYGRYRPLGIIVGLVLSFSFFTLALTALVQATGISANVLRYVAIVVIGVFGLVMLIPHLSDWFANLTSSIGEFGSNIQAQSRDVSKTPGFLSGLILGAALGLVWTPCAGPILAAITTLVATQSINWQTVLMTFAYSLGAGFPLFLIAYGGNRALTVFPSFAKHAQGIRQVFGFLMILTALALVFNLDSVFQQMVLKYIPSVQVENNRWVQKELSQLRPAPLGSTNTTTAATTEGGKGGKQGPLPMIAPAPEIVGITQWINSDPLTIKGLKGKVVLVDFWTYSCINCIRTFPYLRSWNEKYRDKGLTIIGVHTPEFEFEKNYNNVVDATKRFQLTYPVALDNNYKTWQAYHNFYWPADYLIDQNGTIREIHFGEGAYLETENAIRSLLGEKPLASESEMEKEKQEEKQMASVNITPETYLGYRRGERYISQIRPVHDELATYFYDAPLGNDQVGLRGTWKIGAEEITSESDDSTIELNFDANRVYLVLAGHSSSPIRVDLDGHPLPKENYTVDMNSKGEITVKEARKYDIVDLKGNKGRHLLTLHVPKGIQAYAFTFGVEQ